MASKKYDSVTERLPVVVINGLGAPNLAARAYGLHFRLAGFPTYPFSGSCLGMGDVVRAAQRVDELVRRVRSRHGVERVHLVGMSLGGLIGLYYIKCAGGAETIDCFVSVGGPLSGSRIAEVSRVWPFGLIKSVSQTRTDSDIIAQIDAAPTPSKVTMLSMHAPGDVITPPSSVSSRGVEDVIAPAGFFPFGHWCAFVMPANLRFVVSLLERHESRESNTTRNQ